MNITRSAKNMQCHFVVKIAEKLIVSRDMKHIDLDHIFIVRSMIKTREGSIHIYPLPTSLIRVLDIYYIVEVQPDFDLLPEYIQYKEVFHILSHIPYEYKENTKLNPHHIEAFNDEYMFSETFKENLGMR